MNGQLASLSCFLPKLAEKAKPFYKLLKKTEPFKWDETYEYAFQDFKKAIATSLILTRPKHGRPLLLYLSVTEEAVSLALYRKTTSSNNRYILSATFYAMQKSGTK